MYEARKMRRRSASLRSGKRDRKILHPDFHVPPVEAIADESSDDADRIQDEIRQQAEQVQDARHQVESGATP